MKPILRAVVLTTAAVLIAAPLQGQVANMSFFITSTGPGNGADLGGLEGADAHCALLGDQAGAGDVTWRAYLSTTAEEGQPAVNARARIGTGPWYNHAGVMVARDVTDLHSDDANLTKETILTEKGSVVNGRGDDPNRHSARVGHHDRQGGGENPTSWNSAHGSRGCGQADLQGTGGDGLFFCFAVDVASSGAARRE
jgi:hypothetical protein